MEIVIKAVVFGNVTLDVICSTVNEVPRYESLAFDQVVVSPGGCGSNVAIGLCALGQPTALVGRIGSDDAARLVESYWQRAGVITSEVQRVEGVPTGTSVGLIDQDAQPRFIHTSGANKTLTAGAIDLEGLARDGAKSLHIAGFFVLPGVMDGGLAPVLAAAQGRGLLTSLDVVRSPRMADPMPLWSCLPHLDIFLCNAAEAMRISGVDDPIEAGCALRQRGARAVIVKLGREGCWLDDEENKLLIPAPQVKVTVDTTGAGDAFAAGLIAALLEGMNLPDACIRGNRAGAKAVEHLGAVSAWFV
jgi:sugar/nucleoside kinase (ribokinase family)